MKYSILIQWSEEDQAYVASLPEWGKYARTYGETYIEAFENAKEVLEDLVYGYQQMGKELPQPQTLQLPLQVS
ncbi:MAG: type II toxin-antitoxin system HicB family antitoxin [Gomphosphaeria aponina SAG 52.96 = DSM 107014]|uniref:Type II toxin-antitoxin system HicB family antitoxin n=1 Tax=Gomphosphaeria aponina SAG 52.96 = DSM 107014 TaxID=1521640 RepID=A0A941JP06_9CHRO|nr:type II toxin-antitoxin system HicB family antitoxin [Gomphosphaeria aponina SAG 52.96 = DSM 107014]